MKTDRRKTLIWVIFIVSAILIMSALIWMYFCSKSYGDLSIYGITIVETNDISTHGRTVSREEFHNLLRLVPRVEHCPRFQFLKYCGGNTIYLTPKDILIFFLYSGDEETIRITKDIYSGQTLTVTMSGSTTMSVATYNVK